MFAVGSLVAGHRIEQVVATGATGTVYLAKNPTLPRRDALQVLSADLSRRPGLGCRTARDELLPGELADRLQHRKPSALR